MKTETPRTNAAIETRSGWVTDIVPAEFARQLERELDAMTKRANALEGGCHMAIGYIASSTPNPEKSGTYRYLKSVTAAAGSNEKGQR